MDHTKPEYFLERTQTLIQSGELDAAVLVLQQCCESNADDWRFWQLRSAVAGMQHDFNTAVYCATRAITLEPKAVGCYVNLGNAQRGLGQIEAAEISYRKAVSLQPAHAEANNNLGTLLLERDRILEAAQCFKVALHAEPRYAEAHNNLSIVMIKCDRFYDAERACMQAIKLNPAYADALANLAEALHKQGRTMEAARLYEQALALGIRFEILDNYLFCLNYLDNLNATEIAERHISYGRWYKPQQRSQPHRQSSDPHRRLRVGYVSSDFITHPVAHFIEALLAKHDRNHTEVICFSDTRTPDPTTTRLRKLVDRWRDTSLLSHDAFFTQVYDEQIDILVDLSGHTAANRLQAFARQPAPVQVTYLGYPNTTGLSQIQYRITDAYSDPVGRSECLHSEQLVRLPGGFLCYTPDNDSSPLSAPPCVAKNRITFASFNNITKLNNRVLETWSHILRAIPGSNIIIKYRFLAEPKTRAHFRAVFASNGITSERVKLIAERLPRGDHLAMYHNVDIALDPFPYNGTTTTCEALWMGVPVITLAGHAHAGRVGVSLLSQIGLAELIAKDRDDYVRIAAALAGDRERLAHLRRSLRAQMAASPLCDAVRFVREMENAYRTMWRTWCAQQTNPL